MLEKSLFTNDQALWSEKKVLLRSQFSLPLSFCLFVSHSLSLCLWYEQQRMQFFQSSWTYLKKITQGIKKSIKTISFQTDSQLLLFFSGHVSIFCTRVIALTLFWRWKDISAQSVNMRSFSLETWMSNWAVRGETSLVVAALVQDAGLA